MSLDCRRPRYAGWPILFTRSTCLTTGTSQPKRKALAYLGGTLLTEVPRIFKRWFLITASGRVRANLRADMLRGVLAWPMARIHQTAVGELMARIVGDVETVGLGVRRFVIEMWDTL